MSFAHDILFYKDFYQILKENILKWYVTLFIIMNDES